MLMKVGKHPDDLVPTNIVVTDFSGALSPAKGLVTLIVKVGSSERNTVFVVVPSNASYNALLGRDWIHGVGAVPSTVHQSVLLWMKDGKPEVIKSIDFSFDCIYDLEPLGFEKYSVKDDNHFKGFESQDPLKEINLGTLDDVRITYICKDLVDPFRTEFFHLLHEFKDCFAWDYHEMPGLDRSLVEHQLALKLNARPVKQTPRRFVLEINQKIKEEIERLIKAKFIRTARYVEWVSNIVPVIKKNGKLRVCIIFRDLNNATPKDEYFMPIADILIDSAAGNKILSFMDGYSGSN
ncbi:hypothetical protein AAHE18_19G088200 [Arachis hypogaea]